MIRGSRQIIKKNIKCIIDIEGDIKMKQKITLICCAVFILAMVSCSGNKYPLNGIWSTETDEGNCLAVIFFDDICFFQEDDNLFRGSFTYKDNVGTIAIEDNEYNFSVNGDFLNLNRNEYYFDFVKQETKTDKPDKICGIWKGTYDWMIGFLDGNFYLFDDEGYGIYGTYTFNKDSGTFECINWYKGTFTIKGGKMTAKGLIPGNRDVKLTKKK